MVLDSMGNICVTGTVGSSYLKDYLTVKYDPNGNELWVARYDGPDRGRDEARAIATDKFNNIYVTGNASGTYHEFSGQDYTTVIYNPDGDQLWVASYDPGIDLGGLEIPTASIVDRMGNVYVTGYAQAELGSTYLTIMYSAMLTCTAEISGDVNNDCEVDLVDLAIMAEHWLQCNLDPPEACWE